MPVSTYSPIIPNVIAARRTLERLEANALAQARSAKTTGDLPGELAAQARAAMAAALLADMATTTSNRLGPVARAASATARLQVLRRLLGGA